MKRHFDREYRKLVSEQVDSASVAKSYEEKVDALLKPLGFEKVKNSDFDEITYYVLSHTTLKLQVACKGLGQSENVFVSVQLTKTIKNEDGFMESVKISSFRSNVTLSSDLLVLRNCLLRMKLSLDGIADNFRTLSSKLDGLKNS